MSRIRETTPILGGLICVGIALGQPVYSDPPCNGQPTNPDCRDKIVNLDAKIPAEPNSSSTPCTCREWTTPNGDTCGAVDPGVNGLKSCGNPTPSSERVSFKKYDCVSDGMGGTRCSSSVISTGTVEPAYNVPRLKNPISCPGNNPVCCTCEV